MNLQQLALPASVRSHLRLRNPRKPRSKKHCSTLNRRLETMETLPEKVDWLDKKEPEPILSALEEKDTAEGGLWEACLAVDHEYRRQKDGVLPPFFVSLSREHRARLDALGYPVDAPWTQPFSDDEDDGDVQCSILDHPLANIFNGDGLVNVNSNANGISNDDGDITQDGRNKENENGGASSWWGTTDRDDDTDTVCDSSSDEEAMTEEEENGHISQLFQDFPTCITKKVRVLEQDRDHGISSVTSGFWNEIQFDKIPLRIREWIADFTSECLCPKAPL